MEVYKDKEELYLMIETKDEMLTYYKCPDECSACLFPNNCTSCIPNHILQNGVCSKASHCVKNILKKKNVCEEYCSRQCKTCNSTKDDCVECALFYKMDENGQCMEEKQVLNMLATLKCIFNYFKRRGIKSFCLALDDLWLYNYHKNDYDGTALTIF